MKGNTPTKGVTPVFVGVPGILIDSIPDDVVFGERKLKTSPYDPLLLQLKAAGAGKYLQFDDLRARTSLVARAKKLGLKILFGEKAEKLYVSLAKVDLTTDGAADAPLALSQSDVVLNAIKAGRSTAGEITTWARSNGAAGIGITQVDGLLSNLTRAGKLRVKTAARGSESPDRWSLA